MLKRKHLRFLKRATNTALALATLAFMPIQLVNAQQDAKDRLAVIMTHGYGLDSSSYNSVRRELRNQLSYTPFYLTPNTSNYTTDPMTIPGQPQSQGARSLSR